MPLPIPQNPDPFRRLEAIMECLLSDEGCPWDREQDHRSLRRYAIEEAYEVCEAIDQGDMTELRGELGDLGLQIVFHAALARRSGHFDLNDVYGSICEKLIRRHPHVFATTVAADSEVVLKNWEAIKREERASKAGAERAPSALDGVPAALPALQRAQRLQGKASKVGFDWPSEGPVLAKVREELAELEREQAAGNLDGMEDELGDLLFAMVNVARFLSVDPEQALHRTNRKFDTRFRYVEARLAEQGRAPGEATLAEMDALWDECKRHERARLAAEEAR